MVLMSLLPAASAFAATAPTLTMTGPSNISVSPGGSATFTVSGTGLASNEEYQFWVETPSGKWQVAQNYSSNNSFTINNAQSGNYLVEAYAMTPAQIKAGNWSAAVASNHGESDGIFVGSTVSTTVTVAGTSTPATDVAPGTQITAKASSTGVYNPQYQFWVEAPSGHTWGNGSAWKQLGGYSTSTNATFTAPWAGDYKVVAYAKSPLGLNNPAAALMSNEATPAAYGTASAVKLSPASSSVVADGKQIDTVTATVVDSNGNVVKDFNGTATVSISGSAVTWSIANSGYTQKSDFSGGEATFSNGTATFLVEAMTTPGITSTISASGLTPGSGSTESSTISYGSGQTITAVPQAATSISAKATPTTIAVNSGGVPSTVNIAVNDQAGYPMLSGNYPLTVTVTGGGSLSSTSSVTSETLVASPGSTSATVYGVKGDTGTYQVSVAGSGVTGATADITAAIAGNAANLTATDSTPSFVAGGSSLTTITLGATSSNGVPVSWDTSVMPEITVTNSHGNAVTGWTISGAVVSGSTYVLAKGTSAVTVSDPSGTVPAGTYTVSIKDGESTNVLTSTSMTLTEKANTAASVSIAGATNVLTTNGLSTRLTVSVTDAYGNPVPDANVPIKLSAASGSSTSGSASLAGGTFSTTPSTTVTTNASGVATASFTAQNYTGSWLVTASVASGALATGSSATSASTTEYVETHPVASYSYSLTDTQSGSSYQSNTSYAMAGDSVAITSSLVSAGLDANGNAVSSSTASHDNVTVTIDHASGLSGLPTTSGLGVTVATNMTNNTETLSGTLGSVSVALDSLTAAKAGEVTVGISDQSTGATGQASIDVLASSTATQVAFSGITNSETLTTGTAYTVTVTMTDKGGNPVVASSNTTLDLSAMNTYSGTTSTAASATDLSFETSSGVPISQVTIAKGQSSATYMVVTSGTAFSGTDSVTASGSVTGSVTGLTD